ncbi:MAG: hypothetical protein A2W93_10755 [Bacteroidetes bacterium GWF2_43_63]|nr:MAG: hypothetical protein A2W94_01705 [Bacteroidetes bacterium GWE2_42_42]OFY52993.1 MAG: hypothetical protein A2W93_10755 [Bacteroidetes bacterium GWF2_43_63]HCB62182.1 glycosyl transferase family 2 [Bacteroidales bacterium]
MSTLQNNIIVSVAVVTYNHEKYIAQALESILIQQTNFKFEIIIGDDCSKDKTTEICQEYARKYPDKIRHILQPTNVGLRKNNIITWKACRGKYVAMCEGDDYWTDENKLQKQVDLLESNPEYGTCFHQTVVEYNDQDGCIKKSLFAPDLNKKEYTFDEIVSRWISHTTSLLFVNIFIEKPEHPIFKSEYYYSDRPLEAFLAKKSNFLYLNEPMSCFRRHNTNMSKIGNLAKMYSNGAIAFRKMMILFPENKIILSEQVIRWYLLAAEDLFKHKKLISYFCLIAKCFISIRSVLGLKNTLKCSARIIAGKIIY